MSAEYRIPYTAVYGIYKLQMDFTGCVSTMSYKVSGSGAMCKVHTKAQQQGEGGGGAPSRRHMP